MNYLSGLLNDAPKSVQMAVFGFIAFLFLLVVVMEVIKYLDRKNWVRSKGCVLSIEYFERKGGTTVSTYSRLEIGYEYENEERVSETEGRTGSMGRQAAIDRLSSKGIAQDKIINIKINPKNPNQIWVEGI